MLNTYPKYKAAIEAVEAALKLDDDNAVDQAVKMLFAAQDAEMLSEGCSDIDDSPCCLTARSKKKQII